MANAEHDEGGSRRWLVGGLHPREKLPRIDARARRGICVTFSWLSLRPCPRAAARSWQAGSRQPRETARWRRSRGE